MTQVRHNFSIRLNNTYCPTDIEYIIDQITPLPTVRKRRKRKTDDIITYYNVPCAFDIETSSFYRNENGKQIKTAIMYEWTFGIYDYIIIGRTWFEFVEMMNRISELLCTSQNDRLVIYVHNLSFEFQFMRKYFEWSDVFALETRTPVYARTVTGIEFRCSYILSGYNLATVAKNLTKHKIEKLIGDLDYCLIRHSETPLTDAEMQYCINDVKIVIAYVSECIENDGDITKIPLTQTGYVRKFCRKKCLTNTKNNPHRRANYMRLMEHLTITSADEYIHLKNAFAGGFTHANPFCTNKIINDVTSLDFTSAYPTVMISERFPMSRAEKIEIHNINELNENIKYYCCLFDVRFENISPRLWHDNYISESRCNKISGQIINNGRVVSADFLEITITEQDFHIIKQFYQWEHMYIGTFYRYKRGYLPKPIIESVLELYGKKTALKNVAGSENEYIKSKQMLNSCYGMAVTSIIRDEITYTDDWNEPIKPNISDKIDEYNNDENRFLFFPWGVWITAYNRVNLFTGINEMGFDYIYADTDSIKCRNVENHVKYVETYNKWIMNRLEKTLKHYDLPVEMIKPKTKNGIEKPLGVWDWDGHYSKFKTLGAKRYLVMYSNDERNGHDIGKIQMTVSGLNKKSAVPYMLEKYGENIFNAFTDDLYIPHGKTGKLTHTYIDDCMCGEITDYLGNTSHYNELSGVHLCESDYSLTLSREYVNYILGIQTK